MTASPQETILNVYKGKHEDFRRFDGVNIHLFRKIYLITKARSLLYVWHQAQKTRLILHIPYGTKHVFINTTNKFEDFVKGVTYGF